MYVIYTPNLGLGLAVSVRKEGQGRFKGSMTLSVLDYAALVALYCLDIAIEGNPE